MAREGVGCLAVMKGAFNFAIAFIISYTPATSTTSASSGILRYTTILQL